MKHSAFTASLILILLSTPAFAQTPAQPAAIPAVSSGPASAPRVPSMPSTSAASTSADYKLVTGDKLRIEVYKDPQLSQSLQVRPDGTHVERTAGFDRRLAQGLHHEPRRHGDRRRDGAGGNLRHG
jgi:hypothetical protein